MTPTISGQALSVHRGCRAGLSHVPDPADPVYLKPLESLVSAKRDILPRLALGPRQRDELGKVIRMAVPMVITTCSRMVMDIADFKMVGLMGESANAAQGAILPAQVTLWSFIIFGFGTIVVINTFVSQSFGRDRLHDTSAYTWQAVYLGLLYGVIGFAFYPYIDEVFAFIGHGPAIRTLEIEYTRAALFTVAPTIVGEAFASFFNGVHRPKVTMWSAVESNAINIFCSAALIFGWFGLPAMGIVGAAWGTVIGVTYRVIRLALVFLSKRYDAEYGTRRTYGLDLGKMRSIIRVGAPQGLQFLGDVTVWAVFINFLIGRRYSNVDLIASNTAWQFMRISFMPAIGIGIALSALVGKAIGQRDNELANRLTYVTFVMMIAYMAVMSTIYLLWRHDLISYFNQTPAVIRVGGAIMICAVIFQVFDGIGIIFNSALRGAGDTFWPAMLYVCSHWLICIGGGWLLGTLRPDWGVLAPWTAATILLIFVGLALWWRWHSRAWQKIDIFRHERPAAALLAAEPETSEPAPSPDAETISAP